MYVRLQQQHQLIFVTGRLLNGDVMKKYSKYMHEQMRKTILSDYCSAFYLYDIDYLFKKKRKYIKEDSNIVCELISGKIFTIICIILLTIRMMKQTAIIIISSTNSVS